MNIKEIKHLIAGGQPMKIKVRIELNPGLFGHCEINLDSFSSMIEKIRDDVVIPEAFYSLGADTLYINQAGFN